ncbi:MerR family transcriptional regulator [Streptomyces sp. NPDC057686]|uniref:helix-turn-helix domain-containing protein n=1 Tax=Streptomyces sp. NPDC057686 TaxID=3346212 RepID=UPI0036C7AC0D
MNGTTPPHSIGSLSARTGIPVRTIRFYSDTGLLPPTRRTRAGYRRYDDAALDRLRTIAVLRELDVGLPTTRRVLDGGLSLTEVATAHADATELQIRALRTRLSLLRRIAGRGSTPEEITRMHRLTRVASDERRRLVADFLGGLDAGTPAAQSAVAALRTAVPSLPDEPSDEQLDAWWEITELIADDAFRARLAQAELPPADEDALAGTAPEEAADLLRFARLAVTAAMDAGTDPEGDQAVPVVDAVVARFAAALDRPDDDELREWMACRLEVGHDPLVARYWRLVWTVNGWHVVPGHLPFQPWLVTALRTPRPRSHGRRRPVRS